MKAYEDEATYCLESLQTNYIVTQVHLWAETSDTPKNSGLGHFTSVMSFMNMYQ
jgi:hypothetical protein